MNGSAPMLYHYVGSRTIAERSALVAGGTPIMSPEDVVRWMKATGLSANTSSEITVTFVVSEEETLLIADRHSEHVACAGGKPVLAAGELTFALAGNRVSVTRGSNHTGSC
ncbi:MAG: hypothetical protein L0241_28440 [Planctomycetia bacterium]|nr:hypothetical protein [Planctomycetia bacterium]